MNCPFCGLVEETTEHVIWKCEKVSFCWSELMVKFGLHANDYLHFSSGSWLLNNHGSKNESSWVKVLITTVFWLIWKQRCNLIFNQHPVNFNTVVPSRAWSLCSDCNTHPFRECFKSNSSLTSITIYSDASWSLNSKSACLGFVIISNSHQILLAGALGATSESPIMVEFAVANLAL